RVLAGGGTRGIHVRHDGRAQLLSAGGGSSEKGDCRSGREQGRYVFAHVPLPLFLFVSAAMPDVVVGGSAMQRLRLRIPQPRPIVAPHKKYTIAFDAAGRIMKRWDRRSVLMGLVRSGPACGCRCRPMPPFLFR